MHCKTKWAATSALAIACAITAMPVAAQAQEGETAERNDNNQIVVTARKREENLIEVPLAVTVATQAQLERDQVFSINDLQRVTPALEISQTSGGETNGGGRLRGLGTGVFNASVSSSVAFVVDQVPIGNLAFPQLFDLAQVEVLRGPQGTLFGQGASAGVINVTTVSPSFDGIAVSGGLDFADKGTAGSEVGELVGRFAFNLPLADTAALRVAAQYKEEKGLQRSVTTGRDNVIEDWGVRARLRLEPTDAISWNLSVEHSENISDGQTFFAIAIAPNSATPFGPPGGTLGGVSTGAYTDPAGCGVTITERAEEYCEDFPSYLTTYVTALSSVLDLELAQDLILTSVTSYRSRVFKQASRDFSRLTGGPAARQERTREEAHGFSQELRFTYLADNFDLVFGGYYSDYFFDRVPLGDGPYNFGSNVPGERIGFGVCVYNGFFCPVGTSFSKETTENRNYAAFADITMSLTDQLDVFGGLRYSDYSNTTRVGTNVLTPNSTFVTSDNDLSGRIGVSFQPNPDANIFASYSRGYKPPAVGTDAAGTLFQLEPEKSDAFELGARFGVGGFQVSANAFYTDLSNFQSQTSVFVGTALISQPLNIPTTKSKGFELGLYGELFAGLNINAGYQFNDITFPAGYLGDDGGNLGGTQFLNAPKHKFTLSGEYAMPVSDNLEMFVNSNLVYKSSVLLAARADPRFRYHAHELINGGLGVRDIDGAWTASLFVRNLTKEREPTAYLASTFAGQADGGIRAWPVAGLTARVVGVRLGFDF